VTDNAGGVKRHELSLLIAPGESKNDLAAEVIGVFGVGGKRAGIGSGQNKSQSKLVSRRKRLPN